VLIKLRVAGSILVEARQVKVLLFSDFVDALDIKKNGFNAVFYVQDERYVMVPWMAMNDDEDNYVGYE
jgi:hypothetical protein